jgi:hypothetical protein
MRGDANLAGSKSVARCQRVNIGTRETNDAPARVRAAKSLNNGKVVQMATWESDQFIVALKQGNACGGAGTLPPDMEPDKGSQQDSTL